MQMKRYARTVGTGMVAGLAGAAAMTVSRLMQKKIASRHAEAEPETPATDPNMIESGGAMGTGLVEPEPSHTTGWRMLHTAVYAAAAGATFKALKRRFEHAPTRMEMMRGAIAKGAKAGTSKARFLASEGFERAKDSHLIDKIKELPIIDRAA